MSRFETADALFSYLESFTNLERSGFNPREYRLERMAALLAAFDAPQEAYTVIHVAGSKGKGSVCAFAAYCCARHGETVGLYMSPHVSDYRERFVVLEPGGAARQMDEILINCGERIAHHVDTLRAQSGEQTLPTTFELLTLLAFLAFRAAGCTTAVVEVGLGGRLDATNLVAPRVTVISRIELEHTDYLGPDIPSIAREKAGIIKPGVPLVLAEQRPEADEVIATIAAERGAPLVRLADAVKVESRQAHEGQGGSARTLATFRFTDGLTVSTQLRLLGAVQAANAALAALAVRIASPEISAQAIADGTARAWLPGRAELIRGGVIGGTSLPDILLDGAHTPESVQRVLELVRELEPLAARRVLIFGSVAGKQHRAMLELVAREFVAVIISRPGTFKESNLPELFDACAASGSSCQLVPEMEDALRAAMAPGPSLVVVTGSFHLVGAARRIVQPAIHTPVVGAVEAKENKRRRA